jgi:hypothetical protein
MQILSWVQRVDRDPAENGRNDTIRKQYRRVVVGSSGCLSRFRNAERNKTK